MPRRVTANCNPAMLAWARNDSGYTLESASEKTKFAVERLTAWEHGEEKPTIPQLRDRVLVVSLDHRRCKREAQFANLQTLCTAENRGVAGSIPALAIPRTRPTAGSKGFVKTATTVGGVC